MSIIHKFDASPESGASQCNDACVREVTRVAINYCIQVFLIGLNRLSYVRPDSGVEITWVCLTIFAWPYKRGQIIFFLRTQTSEAKEERCGVELAVASEAWYRRGIRPEVMIKGLIAKGRSSHSPQLIMLWFLALHYMDLVEALLFSSHCSLCLDHLMSCVPWTHNTCYCLSLSSSSSKLGITISNLRLVCNFFSNLFDFFLAHWLCSSMKWWGGSQIRLWCLLILNGLNARIFWALNATIPFLLLTFLKAKVEETDEEDLKIEQKVRSSILSSILDILWVLQVVLKW